MTEEAIRKRIKELEGDGSPAPTQRLDLLVNVQIANLKWVLSLLKTDRTALAKRLRAYGLVLEKSLDKMKGDAYSISEIQRIASSLKDRADKLEFESKSEEVRMK